MRTGSEPKVTKRIRETYLAQIENSKGTRMFQNFYTNREGMRKDVLRGGELSCAYYVSSILTLSNLISSTHTTVTKTIKDMEENGWQKINSPKIGCVLIWEKQIFDNDEKHSHIGFYTGNDRAISNSDEDKVPIEHHWTFGTAENGKPKRNIVAMYMHDSIKH